MTPSRALEYSVEIKAQISRRGKMQYVTEVSIPAATFKEATRMRQPFIDEIVAMVKRRQRRKPSKSTEK
jgi:hypothetical protein